MIGCSVELDACNEKVDGNDYKCNVLRCRWDCFSLSSQSAMRLNCDGCWLLRSMRQKPSVIPTEESVQILRGALQSGASFLSEFRRKRYRATHHVPQKKSRQSGLLSKQAATALAWLQCLEFELFS